jgi:hypothetical protein
MHIVLGTICQGLSHPGQTDGIVDGMTARGTGAVVIVSSLVALMTAEPSAAAQVPEATPERRQVQDGPDAAPVWTSEVIAFSTVEPGDARPWRKDPRLVGLFHSAEFPDDIEVVFDVPDSHPPAKEVMWVTVIAHHDGSDRFLGKLLDAPDHVRTAQQGDNVVFRVAAPGEIRLRNVPGRDRWCVAEDDGRGYAAQGWPRLTPFVSALSRGVRAYRLGNFGHNQPEIERCIAELRPALHPEPKGAITHDVQLANFVLARCLAEKYLNKEALAHFERAIALDRQDPYAEMGLIAELTVLVHSSESKSAVASWKERLVVEMDRMKVDFPDQLEALKLLDLIRDPKRAKVGLSPAEIDEGKQIGFGVIRYKYR